MAEGQPDPMRDLVAEIARALVDEPAAVEVEVPSVDEAIELPV